MNKKKQYQHQQVYFNKEFAAINTYSLAAWQKSYIERIKKNLLQDKEKGTLIDIACGSGYVAIEMAKRGMYVIACDLSREAIKNIERYKRKYKQDNLYGIVCKAEKIPVKNASVDYIVANAILEHIPDEMEAVNEWKRILKPGGKMFITVPLRLRYVWPFLWPINYVHDRRIGHLRRYDALRLQTVFNLSITNHFYSGHLVKILGAIFSLLHIHNFDEIFEFLDKKSQFIRYGASNISVILKKPL